MRQEDPEGVYKQCNNDEEEGVCHRMMECSVIDSMREHLLKLTEKTLYRR